MARVQAYPGLVNLNGNLLCAVDVETTGVDPEIHDVIEVAILPLDNQFRPSQIIRPFNMTMKPRRPENVSLDALEVNRQRYADILTNSLSSERVADLLVEWFERLNLGTNKRVSPLGHNWAFDQSMLRAWLGPKTMELIFDGRYRDTMAFATSLNDLAEWKGNLIPHSRVGLTTLAKKMNVATDDAHNALPDCRITAEVYAELIRRFV